MTERDDQAAHLGPDTLADLQEGLLDGDGETSARRHLESCPECRADLAALTALPGRLAAASDVGPVPDLVVHRLDRALAGAADEPAATGGSRTVTPFPAARSGTPRGMRLLQAAAVVVVLLGLGAVAVSVLPRTGSDGDSSTSAADSAGGVAERAAGQPAPITASGQDWTAESIRPGARSMANGSLGPAVALYAAPGSEDGGSDNGASAPSAPARDDAALSALPAGRLADPAALRICVNRLADAATDPVAVDLAEYEGAPAAIIVLPDPDDPASLFVYAVEPTCPVGTFLHFAHVPRS